MDAFELNIDKNNKKKRAIIVCEGASDVAFVSLYLEEKLHFKFDRGKTGVPRLEDGKTHLYHYTNNDCDLSIYSAGGCDRIGLVFGNYIVKEVMFGELDDVIVVVIVDADENSSTERIKEATNNLFHFEPDQLFKGKYRNSSDVQLSYNSFFRIIPLNENGVFENVLINALKKDESYICSSVLNFYGEMDEKTKRHILKKRLFIKSELNCILNLINPTKMFEELSSVFEIVDTSSEEIRKNYGFLIELLGDNNE